MPAPLVIITAPSEPVRSESDADRESTPQPGVSEVENSILLPAWEAYIPEQITEEQYAKLMEAHKKAHKLWEDFPDDTNWNNSEPYLSASLNRNIAQMHSYGAKITKIKNENGVAFHTEALLKGLFNEAKQIEGQLQALQKKKKNSMARKDF